jgi:hypothetical protein
MITSLMLLVIEFSGQVLFAQQSHMESTDTHTHIGERARHMLQFYNLPFATHTHTQTHIAGQSKQCSSLRIIRKSMFKFVIKLGYSAPGDNGTGHPTACQ